MPTVDDLTYTELTPTVRAGLRKEDERMAIAADTIARFTHVTAREGDTDGDTEQLGDIEVVHRFAHAAGDSEQVRWHYVEAGTGEPVVFLHGLPESWYQWHYQLEALADTRHVIAVDLKGYGQSDKRTGDYRQEGVADQLVALLDTIGLDEFNLVTHDRGSVIADYLAASHPTRVLRYARGEQHFWNFHPDLAPQEQLFTDPATVEILRQPNAIVPLAYLLLAHHPIAPSDIERTIQEFAYPEVGWAVPRYFNSSSFRQEWIDRRTRLIAAWDLPVLIIQGAHDPRQPRTLYEALDHVMPDGRIEFIDAGHFFTFENPDATTTLLQGFLDIT